MSKIGDLIGKTKGNKGLLIGTILGLLFLFLVIGIIGGSCLIFGLNLMGLGIHYTIKTILGAAIVIYCLRPFGSFGEK